MCPAAPGGPGNGCDLETTPPPRVSSTRSSRTPTGAGASLCEGFKPTPRTGISAAFRSGDGAERREVAARLSRGGGVVGLVDRQRRAVQPWRARAEFMAAEGAADIGEG